MLDFFTIATRLTKNGKTEVYPKFIMKKSEDLMIRGGDFYAIWNEDRGLWSTDEQDVINLVDRETTKFIQEHKNQFNDAVRPLYMWDAESGMIDTWHKYCQRQCRDNYNALDEKLIFSNTETNKKDYASRKLNYPLEPGSIDAWDKLISTLYDEEERHKIEWAIGSIVTGDSKKLQKFMVFYGEAGTGKSTILNVIQQLFEGYHTVFDAKALGSSNNAFALEAFKSNPLVAIQHDGDLSKIEDNTRLNSLVSHEVMEINEKFKPKYNTRFVCFLFMGTNKPVKITDGKSGLLRRLIDVSPSGRKLNARDYKKAVKQVEFELGAIAHHCREVYLEDPAAYDAYVPTGMMGATNDFYNFVIDSFHVFKREDGTTLKAAWEMYKTYVEEAKVSYPFSQRTFKEELKNYFKEFNERFATEDGSRLRSYYRGFRLDKFEDNRSDRKRERVQKEAPKQHLITFDAAESLLDKECAGCFAQYASSKETPTQKWDDVKTTLSQLDTTRLHYVKVPENHIVIDFDLKDESGKKSFEKNLEEASKWPATYAELSKSGAGIHLHYIYTGDVSKLSRVSDDNDNIEIKVFTGKSSLRRMLTKCNNVPIATISSGLPLKGDDKVINFEGIKNEKMLRTLLKRHLCKEYGSTRCSIDFMFKNLEDAYNSGVSYDVSDMKNAIFAFAANSSNQADYCLKMVNQMKFKSEEPGENVTNDEEPIVFYDVEVFPNLFLVNWKVQGEGKPIIRMINPTPSDIEELIHYRLVGFNVRRYDNHMLYARLMGYDNMQLYNLSQRIVNSKKGENLNAFFSEAYNISYTDIYDYASKKQSLKKWEVELGIHHQELGLPWDEPVPEEMWAKVAEYCDNDVIATEAVWNATQADFVARQIQVDLVKLLHGISNVSVNDTTNSLSQKIIFGNNRKPQNEFNYRDMSKPVGSEQYEEYRRKFGDDYDFRVFDADGMPLYRSYVPGEKLPEGYSIMPFFKGYTYERGKSTYMGEEIGEGGRVFARPGMYGNVWDGDIASQHPHSIIFERLFGPVYTKRFEDIVHARVAVKHKDFELAGTLLGGALKPYLNPEQAADLAQALKIVINSIYGLTKASFANPFRDTRNIDNIVAKRGALFMTLLKNEVEKRGFVVSHVKTDSIKVPDATDEIKDFICKFGKEYGYTFETEAVFEKFCLVNNAVYIAKYKEPLIDKKTGEEIWWTATGAQFAVPYVFKKLFSKKDIEFKDMCETKEVQGTAIYLDMNESLPDVSKLEKEFDNMAKKYRKEDGLYPMDISIEMENLNKKIAEGHNRIFVGRVGNFCPIKPGCGGADLVKEMKDKDGNVKYDSVTGAKGYRWLESDMVRTLGKERDIDRSYYDSLVDGAIETISQFGDFAYFASDDPYISPPFLNGSPLYHSVDFPVDDPNECPWYDDEDLFKKR
jgi:hypothetical protein